MWCRRSTTRTLRSSSLAQRSAIVSPNRPEPTTTRSGFNTHSWVGAWGAKGPRRVYLPAKARRLRHVGNVAHPTCGADRAGHVGRLGPTAAHRRQQQDGEHDQVRLQPHQKVLAVAEVDDEEVAVHVEPLP